MAVAVSSLGLLVKRSLDWSEHVHVTAFNERFLLNCGKASNLQQGDQVQYGPALGEPSRVHRNMMVILTRLLEEAQYDPSWSHVAPSIFGELHLFDFDLDLVLASCLGLGPLSEHANPRILHTGGSALGNLYEIRPCSELCIIDAKRPS